MQRQKETRTQGSKVSPRYIAYACLVAAILSFSDPASWAQTKEPNFPMLVVPAERTLAVPPSRAMLDADNEVVRRVGVASGEARLAQTSFVGEGVVTVHTSEGTSQFSVRVLRTGQQVQSILIKGASDTSWSTHPARLSPEARRALDFVQTHHERGLPNLFKTAERNAVVLDGGITEKDQLIVVREANGTATRYVVDRASSRLTRMELQRGQSADASGKVLPNLESYVFSDFRTVDGSARPFKVDHFTNGIKREELNFTSIRYVPFNRDKIGARQGRQ